MIKSFQWGQQHLLNTFLKKLAQHSKFFTISFAKFLILISYHCTTTNAYHFIRLTFISSVTSAMFYLVRRTPFLIHVYRKIASIIQSPDKISLVLWRLSKFLLNINHSLFCNPIVILPISNVFIIIFYYT